MSKVILVLNTLILIVNFVMAWASTNSQVSVLEATARIGHGDGIRASGRNDPAVGYLRLAHSLEGRIPKAKIDAMTPAQWRAIYAALDEYEAAIRQGVTQVLNQRGEGSLADAHRSLSKSALESVQHTLRAAFEDEQLIRQVATAVIANAR